VPPFDEALPGLRDRHGPVVEALAFRAGYDRGRARRAASEEGAARHPTDGPTLIAALLACLVAGAG
jgi:hypothetical protein